MTRIAPGEQTARRRRLPVGNVAINDRRSLADAAAPPMLPECDGVAEHAAALGGTEVA